MILQLIKMIRFLHMALLLFTPVWFLQAERILVETESFLDHGGWKLDTQFIREIGSPYLLAHALGIPVQDATTIIQVKEGGNFQLFARTNAHREPSSPQIIILSDKLIFYKSYEKK